MKQNLSVGVDCIETNRFKNVISDQKLLRKIFTSNEIQYCSSHRSPLECFSARFAGKEAVLKATETTIGLNKIEITNAKDGRPMVNMLVSKYKNYCLKISLSHTKDIAMAFVLAYKE